MNDKLENLEKLKMRYFANSQIYVKNFIKMYNINLEEYGIGSADELLHWNQEKRKYLSAQIESIEGLKERHIKTLINTLDNVGALQNKLMDALLVATDVKDLNIIGRAMKDSYTLYSDVIMDLNIDAIQDNSYQENRDSISDLLSAFVTDEIEDEKDSRNGINKDVS